MIRRYRSFIALIVATLAAFVLQACLLGGGDSTGGGGINGRWLLVREIEVFSEGGASLSDTVVAPTDTFSPVFIVIQDSTFSAVYYDPQNEKADTVVLSAEGRGGLSWELEGDSVTVVRAGNILRISRFPYEGLTEINEYSLFTAAFPPTAWVPTEAPSTGGELWQFQKEIYTWDDGVESGVDTIDYTEEGEILLLRIKGDTLVIHHESGSEIIGTDRVNNTTWNLNDPLATQKLEIVSRSSTQLVIKVTGTMDDEGESFSSSVTLIPFTQAFPPAAWSSIDSTEPNNTPAQAVSLTVGGSAKGARLTLGDADWFSFQAVSGTPYKIETSGGTDTYLRLYSTDGTTLLDEADGFDDQWDDARIEWVAPSAGKYYFTVRGYEDEIAGRYSVGVAVANLTKPAFLPVQPKRSRHWFR